MAAAGTVVRRSVVYDSHRQRTSISHSRWQHRRRTSVVCRPRRVYPPRSNPRWRCRQRRTQSITQVHSAAATCASSASPGERRAHAHHTKTRVLGRHGGHGFGPAIAVVAACGGRTVPALSHGPLCRGAGGGGKLRPKIAPPPLAPTAPGPVAVEGAIAWVQIAPTLTLAEARPKRGPYRP
jgi:hypothetical protein